MAPSATDRKPAVHEKKRTLRHALSRLRQFGTTALWQPNGPLTRELLLDPGGFGLGKVPRRLRPDGVTTLVCGFCSTGCGLNVHLKEGEAINLSPSSDYPVNLGMACPKGWEALTPLSAPDRGTTPLLRNTDGRLVPVTWSTAMETMAARFLDLRERHGPESLAFLGSGQIATEELALLGALCKFGLGMVDGDGNTRQCMATAVVAYKQAFGFDAPPYTYKDFEESDVIVLVGSNLCIAHPILWERVCKNPHNPEIVVIDPRRTETAMAATQHYAVLPKSDQALFYGLANLLIARGQIARAFIDQSTTGFEAYRAFVSNWTVERTAQETGLMPAAITQLADTIARGQRVSFWWTMGVNQSHQGVRTAQAIINLALLTGNIGRPGTGANSITGQCNAMGSRLYSNTTNLLGGHDFANPAHREKVARILGIDVARIPTKASASYDEILEKVLSGKIRGLWIIGTNPAHSWINQTFFHDIAAKLEFLVVQDMYHSTETVRLAHLYLPSAGWGEKEGSFINSERRIGLHKRVRRAPGQALSDFAIFRLAAESFGLGAMFADWSSPEAVFRKLKAVSEGQPCDITGIGDYADIDRKGGVQWPAPAGTEPLAAERRLFEDGRFFHPDGRARFCFDPPAPLPEPVDSRYPFLLLSGRGTSAQWHTQTRTRKSAILRKLAPAEPYIEICPSDAQRLGIKANERVLVFSRRGSMKARAYPTPNVQPGQVFIPMHYDTANRLTFPAFDPHSHQPAYKAAAVNVAPLRETYQE